MKGDRRIWLIRTMVATLLVADVAFLVPSWRLQDEQKLAWLVLPLLIVVGNAPYAAVLVTSVGVFRRFSSTLWLLSAVTVLAAAGSLYFRWADYCIALQAWEARQAGMHFMCCAPPGRLVAMFLDYTLLGSAGGLAGLIALASTLIKHHVAALRNACHV